MGVRRVQVDEQQVVRVGGAGVGLRAEEALLPGPLLGADRAVADGGEQVAEGLAVDEDGDRHQRDHQDL